MRFIEVKCKRCGAEIPALPMEEHEINERFVIYAGRANSTRGHVCEEREPEDDDTQVLVMDEWMKYEGDRE